MYGTATASSTTSIYSSISLTPSAFLSFSSRSFFLLLPPFILLSFFSFPVVFSFHAPTFTHPDILLSQLVQNILAFRPFFFFLRFSLFFLFSSLSSHVLFREGGKKVYLTRYSTIDVFFFFFLSSYADIYTEVSPGR